MKQHSTHSRGILFCILEIPIRNWNLGSVYVGFPSLNILEIPIRNWNEVANIQNVFEEEHIRDTYKELKPAFISIIPPSFRHIRDTYKELKRFSASCWAFACLFDIRDTYKELKPHCQIAPTLFLLVILEIPIRNWNQVLNWKIRGLFWY